MSILFVGVCNYGYIDMAENLILSFKKNNIENYIIYTLDTKSFTILHNKGYNSVLYKDISKLESYNHQTEHFDEIAFYRYDIINTLLKDNKIVWYLDIDIVVLDNLNKYVSRFVNFDLCVQNDINMACSGCVLFFPTANTIALTNLMYNNRNTKGIVNDQILLNNILHNNSNIFKLNLLDYNLFPNGLLYFNELHKNPVWRNVQENFRKNTNQAKLVHANWMIGHDTKIKALKDKNLWYL
tara:strand:- start:29285 stop:30004 length:720 start_codon:yes stop_codon:yes gene_type:complete